MIDVKIAPIVDWISVVIPAIRTKKPKILNPSVFMEELADILPVDLMEKLMLAPGWEERSGRKPYRGGYANDDLGVYVWGGGQATYLLELSGKGCQFLRQSGDDLAFLKACQSRLTRLDIAIDIEHGGDPVEFASDRDSPRIKSHTNIVSPSGRTSYIGSKQSGQYCRVYRYEPPHPRSHLMRIECVHRKHYAKQSALYIMQLGMAEAAQMSLNRYKFKRLNPMRNVNETLPAPYRDRSLAKTELWLIKQAAPAFAKLVQQGEIEDAETWLREHFLKPAVEQESIQPKLPI